VSNVILPVVTLGSTSTLNRNYTLLHYVTVLHALSNATMPVPFVSFQYGSINHYNQHSYLKAINNLNIILALSFSILVPFLLFLQKFIKIFPQANCDGSIGNVALILLTVSDSCQTLDNYSFLYGIDDDDDDAVSSSSIHDISFMSFEADDDLLIHSVSVHLNDNVDDSSTVFSSSSLALSGLAVFKNSSTRFLIDDDNDDLSSDLSLTFSATTVMPTYVEVTTSRLHRSPRIAVMKPVSHKKFF
jgi:hypothetical protein